MPKVSVIMPVYNGEKYLALAIDSVLSQSFQDFEFIIINDGSTDDSEKIIQSFNDPRIIYIRNESNLGLSKSFNIGVRKAAGALLARMDADDISLPGRFAKQIKFLEENPQAGVVGSSVILIDARGKRIKKQWRPETHLEIKWQSLSSTPLVHPSVMARTEILKSNPYDESLSNSEDYELWSRLLFDKGVRMANLAEPLLLYRTYPASTTQKWAADKKLNSSANSIKNLERYIRLSDMEKGVFTQHRLGQPLSWKGLWTIYKMYRRASLNFSEKEGFKPNLLFLAFSLLKYKLRAARTPV